MWDAGKLNFWPPFIKTASITVKTEMERSAANDTSELGISFLQHLDAILDDSSKKETTASSQGASEESHEDAEDSYSDEGPDPGEEGDEDYEPSLEPTRWELIKCNIGPEVVHHRRLGCHLVLHDLNSGMYQNCLDNFAIPATPRIVPWKLM